MIELEEAEIKAAYKLLKPIKSGMVTVVFRNRLGEIIKEDDDDILLDIEERLINEGWVHQDLKSRLLTPTDKLLARYGQNINH